MRSIDVFGLAAVALLATACGNKAGDTVLLEPAADLSVRKVTANQGVSTVLTDVLYGVPPDQHDLIVGRPGIVRVQVDVDDAVWEPRDITARLWVDASPLPHEVTQTLRIEADSLEQESDTIFELGVPGYAFQPGMELEISLHEAGATPGDPGNDGAFFTSADVELGLIETAPLTVRMIPVRYGGDGSGRMPDLSGNQLGLYTSRLRQLYPASEVVVEVGDTLDWSQDVRNTGAGWETLLAAISDLRAAEPDLPENTYFYGVFNPAESEASYCELGCVLGLSNFGMLEDTDTRASIGLGFAGMTAADTFVHELGHAHGRAHAPCGQGVSGIDPMFPNGGAGIGGWGWDIESGDLIPSSEGKDLMSYCSPVWVSGYTWQAFAERIAALDEGRADAPMARLQAPSAWQRFAVEPDGSMVKVGPIRERFRRPRGEPVDVWITDAAGSREDVGRWFPASHVDGGMLLVETRDPHARVERLD